MDWIAWNYKISSFDRKDEKGEKIPPPKKKYNPNFITFLLS